MSEKECPLLKSKSLTARSLIDTVTTEIKSGHKRKMNLIWLEVCGCSGNIISLLDGDAPSVGYFLRQMVNLKYNNSLMAKEGERAYEEFLNTLDTEFILAIDGAVSIKDEGLYNIIAKYKGKSITGMEAVKLAGEKAKYVLAVGTCASFGGISAARPNPSGCISVGNFLTREVINTPGCPCHPDWVMGTIAHLMLFGKPELDTDNRPIVFYGATIHDFCTRRSFFDNKIFANSVGDKECMFKIGCRGPVTRTDCPTRRWNERVNWPIGDNTPCIGCAQKGFPDGMEPFINI
ncbi:hydrogenase small subunit [Clostridium sp. JNZ J1-5]